MLMFCAVLKFTSASSWEGTNSLLEGGSFADVRLWSAILAKSSVMAAVWLYTTLGKTTHVALHEFLGR